MATVTEGRKLAQLLGGLGVWKGCKRNPCFGERFEFAMTALDEPLVCKELRFAQRRMPWQQ